MQQLEDDERCVEAQRVFRRRFLEARRAGLTLVEARMFAESDTDIGLLRLCVKGQCPAMLTAKILV